MSVQENIENWRKTVHELMESRGELKLPHLNNLYHKLGLNDAESEKWQQAFETLLPEYKTFHERVFAGGDKTEIEELVVALNAYLTILKQEDCKIFLHQSDFASSVLPEFFCALFTQLLQSAEKDYRVNAQGDLVIDCIFDAADGGRMALKKKRVDFAVILDAGLQFRGNEMSGFSIPILAMEIKTNLDKNMISGIESSAELLKRTFPNCLYLVITELADFDPKRQNYAATDIDEIYILRKQKRSAVRGGTALEDVSVDLIREIATRSIAHVTTSTAGVLGVQERAASGVLIGNRGAVEVTRGIEAVGTADNDG